MARSASTQERIQKAALKLFRKKGFDRTTMRDIAKAAGMSLGSTYYYFPQKEALVMAYFEQQVREHERLCEEVFARTDDVAERVRTSLRVRLELMKQDRKFFGGLFRSMGDQNSPVSVFSKENSELRARSLRIARRALDVPGVPEDLRDQSALGLWALILAMTLYFVHDTSPGAERTEKLIDGIVGLVVPLLPFLALPEAAFLRGQVMAVLGEAGLVPDALFAPLDPPAGG